MPTRRQAIIWSNDGKFTDAYLCHSGLNELRRPSTIVLIQYICNKINQNLQTHKCKGYVIMPNVIIKLISRGNELKMSGMKYIWNDVQKGTQVNNKTIKEYQHNQTITYLRSWTHWCRVTYKHYKTMSSFVQITACHLLSTKPSSEIMLTHCNLSYKIQWNFNRNWNFRFIKMHLKMSCANWLPFCSGGDELTHWGWVTHIYVSVKYPSLVLTMTCCLTGAKPLSETML